MKSKCFALFLTCAIGLGSLLVSFPAPATAKTWTLKVSVEMPEMSPLVSKGLKPWAKEVARATNGQVKVVIYPSGTLCHVGEMLDAVESGIADAGLAWPGLHKGFAPLSMVGSLPMQFELAEVGGQAMWELYTKSPAIQAEFKDFHLLTTWATDAYFFMSRTDKKIRTVEDLKGMKIRAANAATAAFYKRLGAVPVMMRMPDVYLGLQKGTLDGTSAQGEAITGFKFYEVIKSYTKPGMIPGTHILIMNKGMWNSMPSDVQQQLMSVSGGVLSKKMGRNVFDAATRDFPKHAFNRGAAFDIIYLPKDEVARFKKIGADPVEKGWVKDNTAKGLPAAKVLADFKKLVKKYQMQ